MGGVPIFDITSSSLAGLPGLWQVIKKFPKRISEGSLPLHFEPSFPGACEVLPQAHEGENRIGAHCL